MTTEIKKEQNNTYRVYDSMGRPTDIYILASNKTAAVKEARSQGVHIKLQSQFYILKRAYNGGIMGQR